MAIEDIEIGRFHECRVESRVRRLSLGGRGDFVIPSTYVYVACHFHVAF